MVPDLWHRLSILAFILLFSCSHPATPPDSPADNRTIALADSLLHFDPGRADSIYRRMLADSSDGYTAEMVKCLSGLAQVYSGRSTFDTALILINQAVSISVSTGDTALIIHSLIGKGNFYLDLGDQNKAESSFRDALMLAQQAGRKKEQHVLFLCLGSIQQESGRYSEAITTFTESVTLAEQDSNIQN